VESDEGVGVDEAWKLLGLWLCERELELRFRGRWRRVDIVGKPYGPMTRRTAPMVSTGMAAILTTSPR